jgi:hypothetical protein
MATEITLDELRVRAARAGLALSEDELKQLLPGINRAYKQVSELRACFQTMASLRARSVLPQANGVGRMPSDELCFLTISEAAAGLRGKGFSALELTHACLRRIESIDPNFIASSH